MIVGELILIILFLIWQSTPIGVYILRKYDDTYDLTFSQFIIVFFYIGTALLVMFWITIGCALLAPYVIAWWETEL